MRGGELANQSVGARKAIGKLQRRHYRPSKVTRRAGAFAAPAISVGGTRVSPVNDNRPPAMSGTPCHSRTPKRVPSASGSRSAAKTFPLRVMFWAKKFVSFWLMPLPLCLTLLVVGLLLLAFKRRLRLGRSCMVAGSVLLLLFSNKVVSTWLVAPL